MKIYVLGHGRHGKDTVTEMLAHVMDLTFVSSSWFVAEAAVYPTLKERYGYESLQACYDDRHNHRKEWYDLICEYNEGDPARLSRELFEQYDIYCGLRNREEYLAAREEGLADVAVWVDASQRLPPEDSESCTVKLMDCELVLDNNDTLSELTREVINLCRTIKRRSERLGKE